MPMIRSFVPRRLQPWIYVFFAFTFQFSGGLYLGALLCYLLGYYFTLSADIHLSQLYLLYDAPIRRELKQMPFWRSVRKEVEKELKMEN